MKWVFLLGLIAFTPALAFFLKGNRRHLPSAAFVLGLLPFIEAKFNVSASPVTWPMWQGIAKGITLSLTDSVAIAMIAAGYKVRAPRILIYAFGLFAFAFVISTALAPLRTPSLFYGWEVLRAVLVFWAVARASQISERVPMALFSGLVAGLATQAFAVMMEYAGGARQSGGWFGHQNLLGMATHFIVFPAFALFLAGVCKKRSLFAVFCAIIIAFAGGSRATIGLMGGGLILVMLLSISRKPTPRKTGFAALAVVALLALTPVLTSAIDRRSDQERADSSDIRLKMISAATEIMEDHPFGVGANRYVVVVNTGGYSNRNGVDWMSASAPVHNTYYLMGAEMGWLGVAGFVAIVFSVIVLAWQASKTGSTRFNREIAVGLTISYIAVCIHAYVEWITVLYAIQILFSMTLGIICVSIKQNISEKMMQKKKLKTFATK